MSEVKVKSKRRVRVKSEPNCKSNSSGSSSSDNELPPVTSSKSHQRRSFQKTADHDKLSSPAHRPHIPTRYEKTLSTYLDERPHIKVLSANRNPTALAKPTLGDDEEVWLIQCPKNVPIENLIDKTLKLNGRRHVVADDQASKSYEYYAAEEECHQENGRFYTAICKSDENDRHQAFSFQAAGVIRFKEELAAADAGGIVDLVGPQRVPYPHGLKVRHPLLGVHYAERTELDKKVKRALRRAVKASDMAKIVKEEAAPIKVEQSFDSILEMGSVKDKSPKKAKKRAAPPATPDKDVGTPHKKPKSKRVKVETADGTDLEWMSKI